MFVSRGVPALRLRHWVRQALWCVIVIASLLFLGRSVAPTDASVLAADGDEPNAPHAPLNTTPTDFVLPGTQPGSLTEPLDDCTSCHVDHISKNYLGSMMANSARDPLFRAALHVANSDALYSGEFCIRCHVPNAWLNGRSSPTDGSAFKAEDMAGVTCNACHRMVSPYHIDGESSLNPNERDHVVDATDMALIIGSGAYIVDRQDNRRGPFDVSTGFHSTSQDTYMRSALMCGTCHEIDNPLYTFDAVSGEFKLNQLNTRAPSGAKLFPVERTYSEWLYSAFATQQGVNGISDIYPGLKRASMTEEGAITVCQDCHMELIPSTLTTLGTPNRFVGKHEWAGGSAVWQEAIEAFWDGVTDDELFDATAEQATLDARDLGKSMLGRAALLDVKLNDHLMTIQVTNNTGHKLPTGYAEGRRMWLEVTLLEESQVITMMGELDANGYIVNPLKVYEIKQGITEDNATAINRPELAGEGFHFALNNVVLKDNRIPPRGWTNTQYESKSMEPVGVVYADGQYTDTTTLMLPTNVDEVVVRLLYQTASGEYLDFLEVEANEEVFDNVVKTDVNWGQVVGSMRDTFNLDRGEQMRYLGISVPMLEIAQQFVPSSNLLPGQPITIELPFINPGYVSVNNVVISDLVPSTISNINLLTSLEGGTILDQTGTAPNLVWEVDGLLDIDLNNVIYVRGVINPTISADTVINNSALMRGNVGQNVLNRSAQASASVVVPRLNFAPSSIEVEEDDDPIEVTVTMNKVNPYAPTTFLVSTQDGSAKAGKDFVGLTNHQVVIAAGASSAKFTIELINDGNGESTESFTIVLNSATAAALGTTKSANISVENEDDGPIIHDDPMFLPGIRK